MHCEMPSLWWACFSADVMDSLAYGFFFVISISVCKNGVNFRNVVAGLLGNSQLDPVLCLLFIFGLLTDKIHFTNREQQGAIFCLEYHFQSHDYQDFHLLSYYTFKFLVSYGTRYYIFKNVRLACITLTCFTFISKNEPYMGLSAV
jgi:hypothetical protein